MRLTFLAHGETSGTRQRVFGDTGRLLDAGAGVAPLSGVDFCGPEPACLQLAGLLPGPTGNAHEPLALDGLAAPAFGAWHALTLQEVLQADPVGLQGWLADPTARPHGGESLADHLARVGRLLDSYPWPGCGASIVASPFTVRAACLHALGAGPAAVHHLDVAPRATATITLNRTSWRLRSLAPPPRRGASAAQPR